ncbi:hypothetical protein D1AOALGA4SA_1594 [Olavius algarvensis Delta 1 endosymbiont]|nr:hypothetical protein D1AOALGA4SA_1594 [Olavius algarvensis Delta 1 endosymbiont]
MKVKLRLISYKQDIRQDQIIVGVERVVGTIIYVLGHTAL